jgi:hypothetical protein
MTVLLAVLSVLAFWGLLTVLVLGLFMILKVLTAARAHLRNIAMGVRAIEQQLVPLETGIEPLAASLGAAAGPLEASAQSFMEAARRAPAAARTLDLD